MANQNQFNLLICCSQLNTVVLLNIFVEMVMNFPGFFDEQKVQKTFWKSLPSLFD